MIRNLITTIFLAILLPTTINAQYIEIKEVVDNNTSYNPRTGMSSPSFWTSIKFRLTGGSKFKKIGITGSRLREYIITDSKALEELDKFKRRKIAFISISTASVVSFVMFGAENFSDNNSGAGGHEFVGKEYLYTGIGLLAVSTITWFSSRNKVFKAVEIYNGNKYRRENKDSGSILLNFDVVAYQNPVDDSATVGLGMKLSF